MQPSGPVVYSELSDYLGLTKNTHESTFFDAIFFVLTHYIDLLSIWHYGGSQQRQNYWHISDHIFTSRSSVDREGALIREGTPQDICPMTTYLLIKCPDILILKWPNTDKMSRSDTEMSRIIPKNIPVLKNLLSLKILKRSLLLVGRYLNNCRYYAVSQ